MSDPYDEVIGGDITLRLPPGTRHELVLARLHVAMLDCLVDSPQVKLLAPRTQIRLTPENALRPDLALVMAANQKLLLAVEVVSSDDHQPDTVGKKQVYEELKVPRLWMVDPRYDNVEVYHATEYGMKLMSILAGREVLEEKLLPRFKIIIAELFAPDGAA